MCCFTLQPVRQHRHFMSRQQSELSRQTVLALRWDLACHKDPSQIHRYKYEPSETKTCIEAAMALEGLQV